MAVRMGKEGSEFVVAALDHLTPKEEDSRRGLMGNLVCQC